MEPDPVAIEAEALTDLGAEQRAFLAPRRGRFLPDPDHAIEWTAWTLEPGEWRIGLGSAAVGLLPRTMVGTSPVLAALGTVDLSARWNALRLGPADAAAQWRYDHIGMGDFQADLLSVGGTLSLRLAPMWSLHLGATWSDLHAKGVPTQLPGLVGVAVDDAWIGGLAGHAASVGIDPEVHGEGLMLRVASDLWFNRRDGVTIQASWLAVGRLRADLGSRVDPAVQEALAWLAPGTAAGPIALDAADAGPALTVTASYTASLGNVDLRIGGGRSAVPLAWALQANDIAWRGGGESRREERAAKRGWRKPPEELRDGVSEGT